MKNLLLENGQLTIMMTNIIIIIFITYDNRTLVSTIPNLLLFYSMIETNIKINDDYMLLIDSSTNIPLMEMNSNNFIALLLHQIELMHHELIKIKRCVHETSYVNAVEMCNNIPLNSNTLTFRQSDELSICISTDETIININTHLKFNKSMIHVLCTDIIFEENFVLQFDWNNLPEIVKNITINNNQMLKSFVDNMHNMSLIPETINIYNAHLDVTDLDIMMKYKPEIILHYNDNLIKYKRIEMNDEDS